jgi:hypothetical protein
MARYCFYCGRSLQSGEKCNCRSTGGSDSGPTGTAEQTTRQQAQESAPKNESQSKEKPKNNTTNNTRTKEPDRSTSSAKSTGSTRSASSTSSTRSTRPAKSATERKAEFLRRLPALLATLQKVGKYVLRPVDAIRESVQKPSIRRAIGFIVFQSVLSGLLLLTAAGSPALAFLFGSGKSATNPSLLFLEGTVLSAAAFMLLCLAYSLLLRYLHRQNFRFLTLLEALSPVSLYIGLFQLLALFSLRTSLISAAILILFGLGLSLLVQFFAMRKLTNMEENQLVMLVFSTSFLTASIVGLVIGLL